MIFSRGDVGRIESNYSQLIVSRNGASNIQILAWHSFAFSPCVLICTVFGLAFWLSVELKDYQLEE